MDNSKRLNLTLPSWLYNKYVKSKGKDPERIRELITKGIMFEKEEMLEETKNFKNNNGINGIRTQELHSFEQFPNFIA